VERKLHEVRYSGDATLFAAMLDDERLAGPLRSRAGYEQHRRTVRMRLLSSAVRVDQRLLPGLDASIRAVRERACYEEPVEAYVFEDPTINAFMTEGEQEALLGISSGAVERLRSAELEFVIGHELGHALFRHFDAHVVLQNEELLDGRQRHQLYAWRRAGEISADRCGLVCCGSVDAAAAAMFRSLSGLGAQTVEIRAGDFAAQWDQLYAEVTRGGEDDLWESSHPLPPLRMKALLNFWRSDAPLLPTDRPAPIRSLAEADADVERLLSIMDPQAREQSAGDPLLEDFCLWGGLFLLTTGSNVDEAGKAALEGMVARGAVDRGLRGGDQAAFFQSFEDALARRRKRLKSLEMTKILKSVLAVGYAKGTLSDDEIAAFNRLGATLGIAEHACDLIRERFMDETKP
jgi:hypothetical protein